MRREDADPSPWRLPFGTFLLWYGGVTLALAVLLAAVICVQGIARHSRREQPSVHPGGRGQARARQGRDAA